MIIRIGILTLVARTWRKSFTAGQTLVLVCFPPKQITPSKNSVAQNYPAHNHQYRHAIQWQYPTQLFNQPFNYWSAHTSHGNIIHTSGAYNWTNSTAQRDARQKWTRYEHHTSNNYSNPTRPSTNTVTHHHINQKHTTNQPDNANSHIHQHANNNTTTKGHHDTPDSPSCLMQSVVKETRTRIGPGMSIVSNNKHQSKYTIR